ncbi:response regulator [Sphingomonas sp. EC-HK361]|uniref:response regulator n=1 Tax=Sphingomonas sp. EC-HK361 TaxID=2038397 RepID=UPI00125EE8D3|nr:response regulator transcription factor [Sphingomonas sp. EC-HK361]
MTARRVILADDHPFLLRGLADLVSVEPGFQVVGMASTGRQALALVERLKPDIAVFDLAMHDLDGLAVLRRISQANLSTRVVLLAATITPAQKSRALALGAWGVVPKDDAPGTLIACLCTVAAGERWQHEEPRETIDPIPPPAARRVARLTPREREIADLVSRGLSNRAIAAQVGTAEGTVKIHLHNIFRKMKVANRTALAALKFENGDRV